MQSIVDQINSYLYLFARHKKGDPKVASFKNLLISSSKTSLDVVELVRSVLSAASFQSVFTSKVFFVVVAHV